MNNDIEDYLTEVSIHTRNLQTVRTYRMWLLRLNDFVKIKKVNKLTKLDVLRFRHHLEQTFEPALSEKTIEYALTIVKGFCTNKTNFSFRVPKGRTNHHRAVTDCDYEKLLAETSTVLFRDLRNHIMLRMLYETGVRVGELCDIRMKDLSLDRHSIVIRTEKRTDNRIVFIPPKLTVLVRHYIQERDKYTASRNLFVGIQPFGEVTDQLTSRTIQRILIELSKKAGIPVVNPHRFRASFIQRKLKLKRSDTLVAKMVGHKTPYTLHHYTELSDDETEQMWKS